MKKILLFSLSAFFLFGCSFEQKPEKIKIYSMEYIDEQKEEFVLGHRPGYRYYFYVDQDGGKKLEKVSESYVLHETTGEPYYEGRNIYLPKNVEIKILNNSSK